MIIVALLRAYSLAASVVHTLYFDSKMAPCCNKIDRIKPAIQTKFDFNAIIPFPVTGNCIPIIGESIVHIFKNYLN